MGGLAIYENAEFRQMPKFLQQFVGTVFAHTVIGVCKLFFEGRAVLKRYLSIFNEIIFDSKVDR